MLGLIIDHSTTWGLLHTGNVLSIRIFWSFAAESFHFATDVLISLTKLKNVWKIIWNLTIGYLIFLNSFERSCQKERIWQQRDVAHIWSQHNCKNFSSSILGRFFICFRILLAKIFHKFYSNCSQEYLNRYKGLILTCNGLGMRHSIV